MSENNLKQFYASEQVAESLRDLDAHLLERDIGAQPEAVDPETTAGLRLAAISSVVDFVADHTVDSWFRAGSEQTQAMEPLALESFCRWRGYLDAVEESQTLPSLDDILMMAAVGLAGRRDHEVRDVLRGTAGRRWVDHLIDDLSSLPWMDRVRAHVSGAIVLICRQANHSDLKRGDDLLKALASLQKQTEVEWMQSRPAQHRDAAVLLGMYHVAQATILTAQFLSDGSVMVNGKIATDFAPELRRLCVRAEEFLQFAGDQEQLLWLKTTAVALNALRASSIWVQAKGISQRIDKLLAELARTGREQPVFSLLPAQQDALRQSLLDQSRVAIVLQMPTSTGKTLLAEFSIAQTFDAYRGTSRVVYVVPTRALATQVRRTLTEDLRPLGISVAAAGSAFEEDPYELNLLQSSDGVVVATPEKLDLLLRSHPEWFTDLRLVIVDEAHLMQDKERGARLELLLANLRREQPDARLLLLTPFMDNAKEVAEWLSRERPGTVSVHWRPTRILLGMAKIAGAGKNRSLSVSWKDPYSPDKAPRPLVMPTNVKAKDVGSNLQRTLFLADTFKDLGTALALFSASPADAEDAAVRHADLRPLIPSDRRRPELRVAIALARHEFGSESRLAHCLQRGVAFHHSSLSPILRYLIEDQVRDGVLSFVAATSTLAQGMNFPVATIVVHSVHKPYGGGNFTSSEFWNMAGRAGRVGMVEKGLVLFADPKHQQHLDRYSKSLTESLRSALLLIVDQIQLNQPLKDMYREHATLRPFIQYLAHAAARSSPSDAIANLEALIQQSLVNQQVANSAQAQKLRAVARKYLQEILAKPGSMIKAADTTGLGTFSFDQLYARLREDPILREGPRHVTDRGTDGMYALVDALRWLPELNLAIGFGSGKMDVRAVARAVQGWIDGRTVKELSGEFPGDDEATRVREASRYLYGTVSQTISWGAHAFLRGWTASGNAPSEVPPEDCMLPSLIQYGVKSPEAAVVSLLGVPRSFAEAAADEYRARFGSVTPETASKLRDFVEGADVDGWSKIVERSGVDGVTGDDLRFVYREMQGLTK
ncbi:MAG: DEAD/DEAH box helicase [Rhodopirellula sp.]|nr:DEAD/DEAH box helicase [Rhodopirellula sp.]